MNLSVIINSVLKLLFSDKVNMKSIIIMWKDINNDVINTNEL